MLESIRQFPTQLQEGAKCVPTLTPPSQPFRKVVISGMGGSALPGDVIQTIVAPHIDLYVFREYAIPAQHLTEETLVIISSFSGNTEETISSLKYAVESKATIVVVTHGGTLATLGESLNLPTALLPDAIQPRNATGLFIGAMLTILEKTHCIPTLGNSLADATTFLQAQSKQVETQGQQLADLLYQKVPIVYSGSPLAAVARIMKINFNETAKIQSFWNVLPEMNHNEMVGFTTLIMNPHILFLGSDLDHPRVHLRQEVLGRIFDERAIPHTTISVPHGSVLEQSLWVIHLAYFASYSLAGKYGVDPAPVAMVEDFKTMLVS